MAEQETSSKLSREIPSFSTTGNNLCQNVSVAPGSSEGLGESSCNNEDIQGEKHRNTLAIGALENGHSKSFPGDAGCGIVRIDGWRDLENRERQNLDTTEKDVQVYQNKLVPSASTDILKNVLGQAVEGLITRAPCRVRKDVDQIISSFLLKQLRNLTAKEKELEARLGQERIEHVVEQVQVEVEFEQIINDMWFSMRADDEAQEMERRERGFEMERREVQLEDEVGMLQGKVRRLENELRHTHAEKDSALQKKQDEMDDIIQNMLGDMHVELRPEDAADGGNFIPNGSELIAPTSNRPVAVSPQKASFLAFGDMMNEADEDAKQGRHSIKSTLHAKENLEDVFHQEQRMSHEKERQLESRLLAMEKEVFRVSGVLRETELALSVEQERRKAARLEVDQVLETWKEEKRIRVEYEEKVKRLLSFILNMKEKLTTGEDDKEDITSKLASVSKDLDNELQRISSKKLSTKKSKLMDIEQTTRWKSQRDAALAERDSLEEKLNLQLRRAWDREAEIEAMWVEKERNLITKCSHLEASIIHWESKFKKRDTELAQGRKLSEIELEAHRKQWADEKTGWEGFVLKREQWLEEQVADWTSLLDIKDRELTSLKKELEELETSFKNVKQALHNPPQQVYDHQKQMLETSSPTNFSCESYKAGRSSEDSEGESCQSIEDFVHEIETVVDEHGAEPPDLGTGIIEKLRLEKEELQEKVSNTLSLMDELQSDFQNRMKKSDEEKRNLEMGLSSKSAEVEDLVAQLNSRDRQMDVLMQKFRDEVSSIDREVEKERKEREQVMEMHFVGKRRLIAEIRAKEESWQNDLDSMTQELLEARDWARQKDEEIDILKEDLQALDERMKAEEQRLSNRIESLIEERDELMAALKQEQKLRVEAEAEYQRLEEEHITLLEDLSAERQRNSTEPNVRNTTYWGNADLQTAVCRVANVDNQISEAVAEIESLREELDIKEAQLVQAKMDKEAEWEKRRPALAEEYKEMLDMREQQWQQLWMLKEQELLSANDKILHQLAAQRGETAIVQGALRELEWSINHGDTDIKFKLTNISKKEGMVKVHTSHLEEVDQYILDLQQKLEESEKKRKSAEIAASVKELKRAASLDVALVQGDRDMRPLPNMVRHDGHIVSHLSLESGMEGLRIRTRSPLGDKSGRGSFSSIREVQPDTYLEGENSSSAGRHGGYISSSTSYGQPRDDYSLSVLPPVSPGRRQQKWLIDAAWLENVRKEQTFLRHQLESERQRVYSFGQIEAEHRLIEAAVVRAVEEKHESESKVLDLQQEVIMLRKMLAARSGMSC